MNIFLFMISCILTNNFIFSKFLGCCPFLGVSSKVETAASMGIASLVQFVEMFLKKSMPALYSALGIYLPLITTNCAVLGVATLNVKEGYNMLFSVLNGTFSALGFLLAIVLMAGVRERLESSKIPKCMKGFPISLVIAGLMAVAFMGFNGMV